MSCTGVPKWACSCLIGGPWLPTGNSGPRPSCVTRQDRLHRLATQPSARASSWSIAHERPINTCIGLGNFSYHAIKRAGALDNALRKGKERRLVRICSGMCWLRAVAAVFVRAASSRVQLSRHLLCACKSSPDLTPGRTAFAAQCDIPLVQRTRRAEGFPPRSYFPSQCWPSRHMRDGLRNIGGSPRASGSSRVPIRPQVWRRCHGISARARTAVQHGRGRFLASEVLETLLAV